MRRGARVSTLQTGTESNPGVEAFGSRIPPGQRHRVRLQRGFSPGTFEAPGAFTPIETRGNQFPLHLGSIIHPFRFFKGCLMFPISIIFHLHLLYFHYSSHTCRNLCQNPLEVPGGPGGVHRTHADVPCGRAEPEGTAVLGPRGLGGLRAKFHPTTFQPETSTRNMPRIATVEMPIIPKFQEFRSHPFESRGLRAADELPAQHVLRGGKSRFGSVLDGRPFIGIRQSPFRQVPAHPGLQFRSPTFCRSNC